jgi:hypothetical protein
MNITRNDEKILNDIHRKFSEIVELFDYLSEKCKTEVLNFHNEHYSLNHCIRYGEIAASEIRDAGYTIIKPGILK